MYVYPNPAKNYITIDSLLDVEKIELYSSAGVLLRRYVLTLSTSTTFQMDYIH